MLKRIAGLSAILLFAGSTGVSAQEAPAPSPDPAYFDYAVLDQAVTLPDGRRIQMVCMGEGSPTVILTAGAGGWGADWRQVHKPIAQHTRACSWDRAGFGFSDASTVAQTTEATTHDLEAALIAANINGPYVMVGHSLGAYESMIFTDRHPDQVVGLVSVDGSIPNQISLVREGAPVTSAAFDKWMASGLALVSKCVADLEAGRVSIGSPDPDGCLKFPPDYPAEVAATLARLDSDGHRLSTQASLLQNFGPSGLQLVDPARSYGELPLIVLTAGRADALPGATSEELASMPLMAAVWSRGHERVAALSSRGVDRIVPDAGHYIQYDRPDIVISTVLEVVEVARTRSATH